VELRDWSAWDAPRRCPLARHRGDAAEARAGAPDPGPEPARHRL